MRPYEVTRLRATRKLADARSQIATATHFLGWAEQVPEDIVRAVNDRLAGAYEVGTYEAGAGTANDLFSDIPEEMLQEMRDEMRALIADPAKNQE